MLFIGSYSTSLVKWVEAIALDQAFLCVLGQCFPTFFSSRPTFNASFIVRPTMSYDQTFATHF